MIYSWESTVVEGRLYALVYSILYRTLEHLWILVLKGGPGTKPPWILRTVKFDGNQVTHGFLTAPQPPYCSGVNCIFYSCGYYVKLTMCFKSFRFLLIFSFVLLVTEKSVLIYYGWGFVYFNLWFYQLFFVL